MANSFITALNAMETRPETKEEEDARVALAQKLYENYLVALTPYLSKKGIWGIQLSNSGEHIRVSKRSLGKNEPGEFRLIVGNAGEPLKFGSTDQVYPNVVRVVENLKKDLTRISQARQEVLTSPYLETPHSATVLNQLNELEGRFGALPLSKHEVAEQTRKEAAALAAAELGEDADEDEEELSFEDLLSAELKKSEKRQRQRERRRQQKAAGAGAGASQ